jgi:hypothetical protein
MSKPGAERLQAMLARNHELAGRLLEPDFPLSHLKRLQEWQRSRLLRSFEDFARREDSRPAVRFFLSELYGGLDFQQRDKQMARVLHLMVRFLPDNALATMSEAFELQAISLEHDMKMATHMARTGLDELDMERYGETYRACSSREERERQIQLIRKLGYDLDRLVRKPMMNHLLRLMRGPAHAAGFGALQDFLENGLNSFRSLEDPAQFVETIYEREWRSMENLFAGAKKPFGF